jgi:ferredoxin-NADP reductase
LNSNRLLRTAKVITIKKHTELIREFVLATQMPEEFKFRAGQFLMLHVPAPAGGKNLLRAYSLASGEKQQTNFRLLIKYIPKGVASEFFWNLDLGGEIIFTGPFGKLFFPVLPAKNLFFFSTGSGLAPHLSYIETFLELYPQCHFEFLIGVRTQNDFFFTDYLEKTKTTFANFNYQFVLSRPDSHWIGRCGYLQNQIESLNAKPENSQFFICGNEDMAKATKQCLLGQGFNTADIFVEIF